MKSKPDYVRGWYAAMDHIANYINSLESTDMTKNKIRSAIYGETYKEPVFESKA